MTAVYDEDEMSASPTAVTEVERASTRTVAMIVGAAWLVLYGIRRGFRTLVPGS